MTPPQGLCSNFGKTDVVELSFLDEPSEGRDHALDAVFAIHPCGLEEIRFLGPPQARQGFINRAPQVLRTAPS